MKDAVLLIEDDFAVRVTISEFLDLLIDTDNIHIAAAENLMQARAVLQQYAVRLIVTDVNLGMGMDALTLASELHEQGNRPYIIVISSVYGLQKTNKYLKDGVVDTFLSKPFKLNELQDRLKESGAVALKI
ncbi:MAG: response regulator [Chitinivibrionales bacterium]|nr:response regulator [Chitinivibrionales bacterium]